MSAVTHSRVVAVRTAGTPWNSRARALAAATRILKEDGYGRLTMDKVASESGVAKTTLYRRWSTKAELCRDVYLDVAQRELRDPDTGDVTRDLKAVITAVVHLQTRTVAGPALIGMIAEAQLNPRQSPTLLADFATQRRRTTRVILQRAIRRGQIRPGTDVDLVIDVIGGATTFRLLQRHAPLSRGFADALVDLVLSGCRA